VTVVVLTLCRRLSAIVAQWRSLGCLSLEGIDETVQVYCGDTTADQHYSTAEPPLSLVSLAQRTAILQGAKGKHKGNTR